MDELIHTRHTPEEQSSSDSTSPKRGDSFKEIFTFALIALLIVVPIRFFVAQPFIVKGASMVPTFESGDYLIVDQLSYRFQAPRRGEVIVFQYPRNPSIYYIKRIIGLPKETVVLNGHTITIIDETHPEGLVVDEPYLNEKLLKNDFTTIELGAGEYFVMGDNRGASSDSRIWGELSEEFIIGKAFVRLFPLGAIGLFPGNYSY